MIQDIMKNYRLTCKEFKSNGFTNEMLNDFKYFENIFTLEEFKAILREKQNRKNKRYRVKEKYKLIYQIAMAYGLENVKIVFGTCTINNENLNFEERTRVKKIDKWLKSHFIYAIVNKDFGSETEREHYHFIGVTNEKLEDTGKKSKKGFKLYELHKKDYRVGFEPDLCIIDLKKFTLENLINYFLKLNNHSNKITTRNRVRIIKGDRYKILEFMTDIEHR